MRSWFVVALIALAACKGKPKHRPPPQEFTQRQAGSAAPDIVLPHGTGAPPKKTTAPIPLAELDKMSRVPFRGFQILPRALDPVKGMEVRQKTEDHPRITATITISQCGNGGILGECIVLDPKVWQQRKDELAKTLLVPQLRDLPDTKFEIGGTTLNNVPLIYVYQLAVLPKGVAAGSGAGSGSGGGIVPHQSYAYTVYYNDGVNQIRVAALYSDVDKATQDELVKEVPRDDLEAVAKAFLDVYTQVW